MLEYVTNDCKLPLIIKNAQTVCHSSFNTCQRLLTLRHGQVALNGNMYADFLENILNQPKRYESLTVLKEEWQTI
ncbi:hypothetical protein C0J52_16048 [Blattella germanica]|nr:hypothetical protein C0J52_16048 [Blattella germanica]